MNKQEFGVTVAALVLVAGALLAGKMSSGSGDEGVTGESAHSTATPTPKQNDSPINPVAQLDRVFQDEERARIAAARAKVEDDDRRLNGDFVGAVAYAERAIEAVLKSPGSAKFGPSGLFSGTTSQDRATSLGDGEYEVWGWVDAQNGFGGLMRMDWRVVVRKDAIDPPTWSFVKALRLEQR